MNDEPRDGKRIEQAVERAERAEKIATSRTANADARIESADAHIADANQQTAHAESHMTAAKSHMKAAIAHMVDANTRTTDADELMLRADEQLAEAAARLAEANDDSDEYQRALYHYTQLIRHRMANPLQVICGTLSTLDDQPDLASDKRIELVAAANRQADVLARICLDPVPLTDVERVLDPEPHV